MSYRKNIFPAGEESDEEYDEFGDRIEPKKYSVEPQVEDFMLVLENACISDNVSEIIRALNSGSVNINDYLKSGWTALMLAASNGSFNVVTYLLKNGVDPLLQYDCHNVIMCVCNCKQVSKEIDLLNCLKSLANFETIDINAKDRTGFTALMYACSNGLLKLVEFLIDHGADIEIKDNQNGETALFFAVRHNHVNVVKFLLLHGANSDATDNKLQTVHRIAESKSMTGILNLLNMKLNMELIMETYYPEEYTYWDIVMRELQNGFNNDVQTFLETLSMEIYVSKMNSNNVTFKHLLSGNENQFINMGIHLSPHRKLLATALKTFHMWNWSTRLFGINKNESSTENIAQTLAIVIRQLHILDASLMYLATNSYGLDPRKGQEAMNHLMRIRSTEDKIFKVLEKRVTIGQVDYMGAHKLKYRNKKVRIFCEDKAIFAVTVILVLLRII